MITEPYEIQIHKLFIERGWTLSTAESCTGGAVSARLTALPGASRYYVGGVVAYSNDLKTGVLAVPPLLIKDKGAVSEDVVKMMASGVLELSGSDFALAVTGIAGPDGGSASKPVGTVWCSFCRRGKAPVAKLLQLEGSREAIILGSVNALLEGVLRYAQQELNE